MLKEEIKSARQKGLSADSILDACCDVFDSVLEYVEMKHPDMHEDVLRKIHEKLSGPHYDKAWAENDVNKISYTNSDKRSCAGAHWTMNEVLDATRGKVFPKETTDFDKYVAYNAMYADMCSMFDDAQIIDMAYLFYFDDEDWNGKGKVWQYMSANR